MTMEARERLGTAAKAHGVLGLYLFGSRADDGRRLLAGEAVPGPGSDLDVGVVFAGPSAPLTLADLQIALDEVFAPLRVDLVPLASVDPLFQFRAIDGHRVYTADEHRTDLFELAVMRHASELLPAQRAIERDIFGISTS
jgi:predicted nucleotidyltransferase